jgi:hypothetical protein
VFEAVCKLCVASLETESADNCPGVKQKVVKINKFQTVVLLLLEQKLDLRQGFIE